MIPQKDVLALEKMGVKKIFLPGTDTKDITDFVLEAQTMKDSLANLRSQDLRNSIKI